ncbi:BlaI/MecI/CopY family transcriptional regulator [Mycolicibacterium austroafricanum]|uniref:BlaI/MecI/CopY family transcriptional regulator n=1 Tax=Mycolicibacterium austroafricanum TaxID=39687 RepID=UPI00055DA69B|nr:BlaI/MecI/CopY family transcriptional regulator [Mycolicibacterium austroafricanum]QZY46976.1 BlaI/MecI/CopY family transcriptional regulator [Mycolicibacterium austroafricanum]
MTTLRQLGTLERSVMDHLWAVDSPQTVRQVHHSLCAQRTLAYTTVTTVLRRLAGKNIVLQMRDGRTHRYVAARSRDELVATLMIDALAQVDHGDRQSALAHFVAQVGADEKQAIRRALAAAEPSPIDSPCRTSIFTSLRSA